MMVFISNGKLHVSAYSGHHGGYSPKHVVFPLLINTII